jgi:hypothetical protein
VRRDLLDWLIELRNRGKKDAQDAMLSANNKKSDNKFGKFNVTSLKPEEYIQGMSELKPKNCIRNKPIQYPGIIEEILQVKY